MKRSKFALSNTKLFSCDMGELVPIGLMEVLPGDTVQHATSMLLRTMPLLAPVMHPVDVRIHHWFVPHRLVWEDFEDFITGGPAGVSVPVFPTISLVADDEDPDASGNVGQLADYLGCPPGIDGLVVSALPFRGYNLIYNEWYRDQDLMELVDVSFESGDDEDTNTQLLRCAWEKDYFTSSRPFEQKGPSITLPLGTTAPVVFTETGVTPGVRTLDRGSNSADQPLRVNEAGTASASIIAAADLTSASAITVNLLREALALQRFEENRARFGSRYTEYLRYLGVRADDARLQRPEYLGGGRQTIQFSEVLQTFNDGEESPLGQMGGHGIAAMRSNRYRKFFTEHGYVFTLMSVRPKTIYVQGLARTWNRRSKEDFFQVELQAIGQQEVANKEVYAEHPQPDGRFGWQDRYDEYRRMESSVAGEFRTEALDYWHLGRSFETPPGLNEDFVTCTPTERVFPLTEESDTDVLYCHAKHSIQARRIVARTGKSFIY